MTRRAVEGAKEMLSRLSKSADIYVATGAAESTEQEIQKAFDRVKLSQFIQATSNAVELRNPFIREMIFF